MLFIEYNKGFETEDGLQEARFHFDHLIRARCRRLSVESYNMVNVFTSSAGGVPSASCGSRILLPCGELCM